MAQLTNDEKIARDYIVKEVEKVLDLVESHFQKYCNEVAINYTGKQETSVPMIYIKNSISIIKKSYRQGAEEEKKEEKTAKMEQILGKTPDV